MNLIKFAEKIVRWTNEILKYFLFFVIEFLLKRKINYLVLYSFCVKFFRLTKKKPEQNTNFAFSFHSIIEKIPRIFLFLFFSYNIDFILSTGLQYFIQKSFALVVPEAIFRWFMFCTACEKYIESPFNRFGVLYIVFFLFGAVCIFIGFIPCSSFSYH